MSKINREEYEILKSLDEKWKWIARDKDRGLYAYTEKPVRKYDPSPYWDTETEEDYSALELFDEIHLFQFIQWEDEEPHNIAELIEEYESEETEVKKDKKWFVDRWTKERNKTDVYDPMYHFINEFIADVNQLDEPEVLSQEWIRDNQERKGIHFFVNAIKLQNLLVPKQEEVDRAYKDGYEKGKQHTFYKGYLEGLADKEKESETVADVVSTFWKSFERLKEVMNMEVEELEE